MNVLKEKLLNGQAALGGWCSLDHPGVARLLALAGFDYIVLDEEHGIFDRSSMRACIAEVERANSVPVVRLESSSSVSIKHALDAGAKGIIVPQVNTAETAQQVVHDALYPPLGERGTGCCRACDYGIRLQEYVHSCNDDIVVALQVEHRLAVQNIEALASVKGVDALFVGPADMAGSYGYPLELENETVKKAIAHVFATCRSKGMHIGMWCPSVDAAHRMQRDGAQMVCIGLDALLLHNAAKELISAWKA